MQCKWWVTKALAYALNTLAKTMPKFHPNTLNWAALEIVSVGLTCTTRSRLEGVPPSLDELATHLISELCYALTDSDSKIRISDVCNRLGYLKVTLERRRAQSSRCPQMSPQSTSLDNLEDDDNANQIIRDEVFGRKMILSSNCFTESGLVVQHNSAGTFYFLNYAERLYWLA